MEKIPNKSTTAALCYCEKTIKVTAVMHWLHIDDKSDTVLCVVYEEGERLWNY